MYQHSITINENRNELRFFLGVSTSSKETRQLKFEYSTYFFWVSCFHLRGLYWCSKALGPLSPVSRSFPSEFECYKPFSVLLTRYDFRYLEHEWVAFNSFLIACNEIVQVIVWIEHHIIMVWHHILHTIRQVKTIHPSGRTAGADEKWSDHSLLRNCVTPYLRCGA